MSSKSWELLWKGSGILFLVGLVSVLWPLPPSVSDRAWTPDLEITARDHTLLRRVRSSGRTEPIALDAIPQRAVDALVATEDRRFYVHPGVDPLALLRALWSNMTHGEIVSGGSTITMQVARLLRDDPPRTVWNKLVEMHLALRLELRRSKREILALWFNRVPFGNRARGIEAAAELYFGKRAQDLTPAQSAYLVGLPRGPSRYNPFRHPARAKARQQEVLKAMERAAFIRPDRRRQLGDVSLDLTEPEPVFRAPHLTRWLLHNRVSERTSSLTEIRTTLDASLQSTVADLVKGHVALFQDETLTNAAAIVLENRTGAVRAYVGSADFWNVQYGGQNDGVRMLRQPGSALKPFTYAHALATRRYTPVSILADIELSMPGESGAFRPENYDETYHGPTPLRQALASSFNVPAVRLAREFGPSAILETLHQFGFSSLDRTPSHYGVGLTLGNGEVQLIELARAYAALARGGSLPPVYTMRWARTGQADTTYARVPVPRQTGITPPVAHLITRILDDPVDRAPGFGRGGPLELPFPLAVKTGTSKDYRDNWTVGYTPRHTVAVWAGNFDGTPMDRMSGVTGAAPLFHSIMRVVGSGGPFERPAGIETVRVCPASGKRPGSACPAPRRAAFLLGTVPSDTCEVHRLIAVDRRTGRRAGPSVDPEHVQEQRYTVYPAPYHTWMREHDVPFPPPPIDRTNVDARANPSPPIADRLHVRSPADHARFYIDPILRRSYQRLPLRGTVPDAVADVHWVVDGERHASGVEGVTWALEAGRHRIALRGRYDGRTVQSKPVHIRVIAASATAEAPPPGSRSP